MPPTYTRTSGIELGARTALASAARRSSAATDSECGAEKLLERLVMEHARTLRHATRRMGGAGLQARRPALG